MGALLLHSDTTKELSLFVSLNKFVFVFFSCVFVFVSVSMYTGVSFCCVVDSLINPLILQKQILQKKQYLCIHENEIMLHNTK